MVSLVKGNGQAFLGSSCVVLGVEYGKNHDVNSNVFLCCCWSSGLFNSVRITENYGFNDAYKTMLDAYKTMLDAYKTMLDAYDITHSISVSG